MTLLNFAWRVHARTGPPLISTHSHLPLSCQSRDLKITARKKEQPNISLLLPHSQPVIDTLTHGMNTSTKGEKRASHLDSISLLDPLNSQASWNVLSPCCPGCAIFIPVQPLCSSTCHLHSELPAADLLTASERQGSHVTEIGRIKPAPVQSNGWLHTSLHPSLYTFHWLSLNLLGLLFCDWETTKTSVKATVTSLMLTVENWQNVCTVIWPGWLILWIVLKYVYILIYSHITGLILLLHILDSRPSLVGTMDAHALLETVCIPQLNFNLFLVVSSSAHTWCYNYIWAIGSTVFQLVRVGRVSVTVLLCYSGWHKCIAVMWSW